MMHRISAIVLFAAFVAPATASAQTAPLIPVKSEQIRIVTRAPNPADWDSAIAANRNGRIFKCKPKVCADPEIVVFSFSKGSFKPVETQALEHYATVELPKLIRAGAAARTVMTGVVERIETLASAPAVLKNFPAVRNETKFTQGGTSTFLDTDVIFAGPIVIRIESKSTNRALAQTSLAQFVEVLQITETPTSGPKPQSL